MPKKVGKKKAKKKSSKSKDDRESSVQLGSIPNRTMVQQMASETLSVAGRGPSGSSSRERVRRDNLRNFYYFLVPTVNTRIHLLTEN